MDSRVTDPNRLLFIDVARSVAIVSVLVNHALQAFQGFVMMGLQAELRLRLITRNSLPLFVFMFGMMLELVYLRKWQANGGAKPARRLIVRSLQCYLGYLASVVAGLLAGLTAPKGTLKAALFLANAQLGNVLRFYAIALLLAIPILYLRNRFGRGILVGLLVVIWGAYPLIESLQVPRASILSFPLGMVFGPLGHLVGPSVLQGLTFVLAGMLCGSALANWRENGLAPFRRTTLLVVTTAAIPVLYLVSQSSISEVAWSFAGFEWRPMNHPGYYSIGVMNCGLLLITLSYLFPTGREISPRVDRLLLFGRSSLMAFTAGNVILILLKGHVAPNSALTMAAAILLFLVAVWTVLLVKEKIWDRRALSG